MNELNCQTRFSNRPVPDIENLGYLFSELAGFLHIDQLNDSALMIY